MSCHAMVYRGKTKDGLDLYCCDQYCGEEWAVSDETGVQTLQHGRGQITPAIEQELRDLLMQDRKADVEARLQAVPSHVMTDRLSPADEFELHIAACSRRR